MKQQENLKKKGICVVLTVLIIGGSIGLYFHSMRRVDLKNMQGISLECLDDDGQRLRSVRLEDHDAEIFAKIISEEEVYSDTGFIFASGGFRIKIKTKGKDIYLYPYCGDVSYMRVGHEGYRQINFEDKNAEKIERIIDKYIDTDQYGGDWNWDKKYQR